MAIVESKPARAWCFTLNNPTIDSATLFGHLQYARYAVYQHERGEQDTLHAQGYVEFTRPVRLAALKKMLATAHWEPRMGTREQARAYCMKEDTRVDGPWEHGLFSSGGAGTRTDLQDLKRKIDEGASIEEIADEHFKEFLRHERGIRAYKLLKNPKRDWKTKVIVLVGMPNSGKSHWARTNYPDAYWKQNSKWWCGYDNHETVIMDDFYGWLPWSVLLNIMDCYPVQVETKGGNCNFVAKTLIITSNADPNTWYDYKNSHMNWAALERRIDQFYGCKYLDDTRILKDFGTDYRAFSNYISFTDVSEFPHNQMDVDVNNNNQ